MKTKKYSRLLALLLAVAAVMSLSLNTFAAEVEESAIPSEEIVAAETGEGDASIYRNCNHTWKYVSQKAYWVSEGSSGHRQYITRTKTCTQCGVLEPEPAVPSGTIIAHSLSDTGSYEGIEHIGTTDYHSVRYYQSCTVCGYSTSVVRRMACPGNQTGHCIW